MIFPNEIVYVWFLFPMRARYFVILFGLIELYASIAGTGGGIAHVAHLGGMLFGYLYINYARLFKKAYMAYFQRKARKSRKNIYVVDIEKKGDKKDHYH